LNILENLPVGIITFNKDFIIDFVNDTLFDFDLFTKSKKEDFISHKLPDNPLFKKALKNGIEDLTQLFPFEKEIDYRKKISGKFLSLIVKGVPFTEAGDFSGGLLLIEDIKITEEVKGESLLRTNLFKDIISSVVDFYVLTDKAFNLIYSSDKTFASNSSLMKKLKSTLNSGEELLETEKGKTVQIAAKSIILRDKGAELLFITGKDISKEISERENILSELKSAKISEAALNKLSHPVFLVDETGKVILMNSHSKKMFRKSTAKNHYIQKVIVELTKEKISELIFSGSSSGKWESEIVHSKKHYKLIADKFDTSASLLIVELIDLSEFRERVTDLEKSLELLKKLFYKKNILLKYNSKGKLTGLSESKSLLKEIFKSDHKVISDLIPATKEELYPINESSFRIERNQRVFYVNVVRGGNEYIMGLNEETRRVRAEEKAAELENKYSRIVENMNEFYWESEKVNGEFSNPVYSDSVQKITGYSADELNRKPKLWLTLIHPNDKRQLISNLQLFYANKAVNENELQFRIISRSRKIVWLRQTMKVTRDENGMPIRIIAFDDDITTLMNNQQKMEEHVSELEDMNKAKDRFVSIISHDLRTPFSSVLGFTDLLLNDNSLPEEKRREYIHYIQDSSKTMLKLVNSLLDWTRLQTGRIQFNPEKLSLKEVVNNSIQTISGTAMQKGIRLFSEIKDDFYVHADQNLLAQVFNNLLGNAIKFTRKGDTITVSAKRSIKNNSIEVSVSDTGVGIAKEDIPKLFRADSKFTNPGTSGEKGTGLGLSLVAEIIKKHRGTIDVESEPGKGTKFIFTLPVSSSLILLADSNPTDLLLYSKLIKSLFPEFNIETAKNKFEIEKVVAEKAPVIIITETDLEDYSVYNLMEFIKNESKKISPALIVLTRKISPKEILSLKNQGVQSVFSKPVELSEFRTAIQEAIRNPKK
jgi:two-component system sensor histidine kinase/response regulator